MVLNLSISRFLSIFPSFHLDSFPLNSFPLNSFPLNSFPYVSKTVGECRRLLRFSFLPSFSCSPLPPFPSFSLFLPFTPSYLSFPSFVLSPFPSVVLFSFPLPFLFPPSLKISPMRPISLIYHILFSPPSPPSISRIVSN